MSVDVRLHVPTFGSYVLRTAVAAVVLSAACLLFNPILASLLAHEFVGFMPKWLALTFGTVHSPSFVGLFAGLFLEWFALGLLLSVVLWMLKTRGHGESAT